MLGTFLLNINYIQGLLYLIGGLIVFSVFRIARKGYRVTRSPTLLRITISFIFLTLGLFLNGFAYFLGSIDFKLYILGISLAFSSLLFIIATLIPLLPSGSFFTTYSASIFWINYGLLLYKK